jgi:fucokinase
LVVYFTGQQRLARDILRRVMGRWLARDAAMVSVMDELKSGAAACRDAIAAGRWKDLAREVNRYWRIKRELYPASTTPAFDRLLKDLRGSYDAASLAGAGGGGFAYFVCRDPQQAARLRERLEVMAQGRRDGSLGATYDMAISRRGLAVTEA